MIFWKPLAPGFEGPPVPVEINLLHVLITTLLVGLVILAVAKFTKQRTNRPPKAG